MYEKNRKQNIFYYSTLCRPNKKMQKTVVKYIIITFLLLIYINRGLFLSSALEIDNQINGEVNSVVELLIQWVTGEENGIDEDGDIQSDCSFVKIVHHDFSQQLTQSIELMNLFSKNVEKFKFSIKEELPFKDFYSQIDRPPEV